MQTPPIDQEIVVTGVPVRMEPHWPEKSKLFGQALTYARAARDQCGHDFWFGKGTETIFWKHREAGGKAIKLCMICLAKNPQFSQQTAWLAANDGAAAEVPSEMQPVLTRAIEKWVKDHEAGN